MKNYKMLDTQWRAIFSTVLDSEGSLVSYHFTDRYDYIIFKDETNKQFKWNYDRITPCINLEEYHEEN